MAEYFPNSSEPIPAVLTEDEAVRFLRLDEGASSPGSARRALRRLVETGRIRPVRIGRSNRFAREELHRFILGGTELLNLAPNAKDYPWK